MAFLPSCVFQQDKLSIQLKNLSITPKDEAFLKSFAATLIPANEGPGAAELGIHLFALKMADDCLGKEEQAAFTKGLKDLQVLAEKELGASFDAADPAKRLAFLQKTAEGKDEVASFVNQLRGQITRGYTQSEHYLTKVRPYKLVPGKYKSCIPVNPSATKS